MTPPPPTLPPSPSLSTTAWLGPGTSQSDAEADILSGIIFYSENVEVIEISLSVNIGR